MRGSVRDEAQKCDEYYLADRIRDLISEHQPLLEAGCGSGKWVVWAAAQGCKAIGVDWSGDLIARANTEVPEGTFLCADLRDLPLPDSSMGSIISLGAIEHVPEGPEGVLHELHRVLRSGGRALITVPYLGPVRRLVWKIRGPIMNASLVRRLLRKPRGRHRLLREEIPTRAGWTVDYLATTDGWAFYQYQLDKATMRELLHDASFIIEDEFVFAPEEGLVQTFWPLAGRYEGGKALLSPLGRLLEKTLPRKSYEHMLGYSVRKP